MKRIAVFGYSIMSLEVMSRLNEALYQLCFYCEDESEAALVSGQGFETKNYRFSQ